MPTTYNGIGTHYYGRRNPVTRPGTCPHCHRNVTLESYDTKLWFVFVFLPVIPLGRKRIIDKCSACSVHMAVDADQWETAKQLEVSGAREQFRTDPTPDNAIAAHQQLINFHQHTEAAQFRETLNKEFADHAKVQASLGLVLERLGQPAEAQPHFQRALAVRPDLPEARVGVAREHMRQGRLDEARQLLDFLERPGAGQLYPLEPIETLGVAFQKAGRHAEALELFGRLHAELPRANEHRGFRKMVAVSERALGRTEPLLPKPKFGWRQFLGLEPAVDGSHRQRRLLAGTVAVCLVVAAGFLLRNSWVRTHRPLHVVNGFSRPAQIEFRGVGSFEAPPGHSTFSLPEGSHHATVRGPVHEEVELEIRADYWDRWTGQPAWVLNVGGEAVLELLEAVYSQEQQPGSSTLHFGESFLAFPTVNHPFTDLPEKVQVSSSQPQRTLTALRLVTAPPAALVEHLHRQNDDDSALRLCELRLPRHPADSALLNDYLALCSRRAAPERARKFLQSGLTNRPVVIEWHRAYQSLKTDRGNADLIAEYDALLDAEPGDSALLYLRARLDPDPAKGQAMFEQARRANPQNPFAWFALGWRQHAQGNWAAARTNFSRAVELAPNAPEFLHYLDQTRLALGEHARLATDLRARLARNPLALVTVRQLVEVLVADGRNREAADEVVRLRGELEAQAPAQAAEFTAALDWHRLYLAGEFAELERSALGQRTPEATNAVFYALIEQGRVGEAVRLHPLDEPQAQDPAHFLAVALAWHRAGDLAQAIRWQTRAQGLLAAGFGGQTQAARFLSGTVIPTAAEVTALDLPPKVSAIVLARLTQLHPTRAAEFSSLARRLNVDRGYPYQLVRRVTDPAP